jgi:hypothetical protein
MRILCSLLLAVTACAVEAPADDPSHPGGGKEDGQAVEIISEASRQAYCAAISPNTDADPYAQAVCENYTGFAAQLHLFIEGCRSDRELRQAMACVAQKGADADCRALYDAWFAKAESPACEPQPGSIGVGDNYPWTGDGSWFCAGYDGDPAGFCSRSCNVDAQCAGLGEGGLSRFGYANVCVNQKCVATCETTTDCADRFDTNRVGDLIACNAVTTEEGSEANVCQRPERRR